jgi:hypothetical protein
MISFRTLPARTIEKAHRIGPKPTSTWRSTTLRKPKARGRAFEDAPAFQLRGYAQHGKHKLGKVALERDNHPKAAERARCVRPGSRTSHGGMT